MANNTTNEEKQPAVIGTPGLRVGEFVIGDPKVDRVNDSCEPQHTTESITTTTDTKD